MNPENKLNLNNFAASSQFYSPNSMKEDGKNNLRNGGNVKCKGSDRSDVRFGLLSSRSNDSLQWENVTHEPTKVQGSCH